MEDPKQSSSQEDRHGRLMSRILMVCEGGYFSHYQSSAFLMEDPKQSSSQEDRHGRLMSRILMCLPYGGSLTIFWSRGQLNPNLLLHHMAENQSGEVEESKAPKTFKVDVKDIDGVSKIKSHTISLAPSLWRVLNNLLVKRTDMEE
ncbi:Hypothetical predicted protein [Mytilus galloprovincialis]|uniref:Uncharacterized protein n=1 Tax=Mytilus galloprovincialis TaxID=29158 RepID=A0A8B6CI74_MYTGA|nr:Hypothetical predicted protein [Mytilus galloprovincialis]